MKEQLDTISSDTKRFKIGVTLVIFEHITIIILSIMLYQAYGELNSIMGIIWLFSRITEAFIQLYDKKNYSRLNKISMTYSQSKNGEKMKWIAEGNKILKTKENRFSIAQILFSIGTLMYCIVFIYYEVSPAWIGWLGIVSSITYALGNIIYRINGNLNALWNFGGLLIFFFELMLGGWLLFFPLR